MGLQYKWVFYGFGQQFGKILPKTISPSFLMVKLIKVHCPPWAEVQIPFELWTIW